jgi:hypothetical protein
MHVLAEEEGASPLCQASSLSAAALWLISHDVVSGSGVVMAVTLDSHH